MTLRRISIAALFLALAGLMAVPNSAQAQQQDQNHFEDLISALNDLDAQVSALEEADLNAQNIKVVKLSELQLNDKQMQTLNQTFQEADTEGIQQALTNNQVLNEYLNQNDIDPEDVSAVNVRDNGKVVLYVDEEGLFE